MRALQKSDRLGQWRVIWLVKSSPCQVVKVRGDGGVRGYLKHHEDRIEGRPPSYSRKRFKHEFAVMTELANEPGVIPVLDRDASEDPKWFVTSEATLLADHFGVEPHLWDVVNAFAHLADTLARLQERGITHRDLKPPNLFWLEGEALLGDFGIAGLPDPEYVDLTEVGNKVGPWGFIAPEALEGDERCDWRQSDVYSLAKCLWKVAMGKPFPPQGTLYIREHGTSLYPAGGKPALELGRLLEMSTHARPDARPRMHLLRDELSSWLTQNPRESIFRPTASRYSQLLGAQYLQQRAEQGGIEGIAVACARDILNDLRSQRAGSSSASVDADARIDIPEVIERSITGGNPEWERDFDVTLVLSWDESPDVRVVVLAIGTHDDATYVAQWQELRDDGSWVGASPAQSASGTLWFPSDVAARRNLSLSLAEAGPGRRGEN